MVYLENSAIRFWRCEQISPTNVVIQYGKCGSEGRKLLKEFEESCEAESYIFKQEASKRKSGYVDAKDPVTGSHNRKRKSKAVTPCSSKKVGLAKYPPSNMDHAIEVDSGLKVVNKILFRKAEVYLKLHAKLAQVEPTQNMDKYYIIQTIVDSNHKRPKTARRKILYPNFYLFTRWGHTGTGGQAKLEGPFNEPNDAIKKFESIFKSKTGVDWSSSIPGTSPLQGKYEHLGTKMNPQEKGSWLYYLENDPLGKTDGWYAYDKKNSNESEELYNEYQVSNYADRLSTRFIYSESSGFTYKVDLAKFHQTNTTTQTKRPIFRSINGKDPRMTE